MARYIENLNECTDPTTGDYLWVVDASAGSTDKDRKVNIANFGLVHATTTWTPVLLFGGASTGITGTFTGRCVRIGNIVAVYAAITLTSKGSATGTATITGLPFAPAYLGILAMRWRNMASAMLNVTGYAQTNSIISVLGATALTTDLNSISDTVFSNTTELIMSGVYLTS